MTLGDFLDETAQRVVHVGQRLTGRGFREEDHEIDRMPFMQRHADLGVLLEPTDPGAMAGARIDNDDRRLVGIDAILPALVADLDNAQQGVVHGVREVARIEDRLVLEVKQGGQARALMLQHVVGALAQGIPEQDRALPKIETIVPAVVQLTHRSGLDRGRSKLHRLGAGLRSAGGRLRHVRRPVSLGGCFPAHFVRQ